MTSEDNDPYGLLECRAISAAHQTAWHVKGDSLNGERTYEVQIDPGIVPNKAEARRLLGNLVVSHVYSEHGSTPAGMPWLLNPMTTSVNGEPSLAERLREEARKDGAAGSSGDHDTGNSVLPEGGGG